MCHVTGKRPARDLRTSIMSKTSKNKKTSKKKRSSKPLSRTEALGVGITESRKGVRALERE